jgi:hypothetical protein
MEEMKDIAACMEQIPESGAIIRNMSRDNPSDRSMPADDTGHKTINCADKV